MKVKLVVTEMSEGYDDTAAFAGTLAIWGIKNSLIDFEPAVFVVDSEDFAHCVAEFSHLNFEIIPIDNKTPID